MQRLRLKETGLAVILAVLGASAALAADAPAADVLPAKTVEGYDGNYLVTPAGMALYPLGRCTTDRNLAHGTDQQSGIGDQYTNFGSKLIRSCQDKFKPYVADADAKPVGEFSIVNGPGGVKQWAHRRLPLWFSIKDKRPGERNANGGVIGVDGSAAGGRGGGAGLGGFDGGAAAPAGPMPIGFRSARQEEGTVITATDGGNRPVFTPTRNARLRKAGYGGPEPKPILAPALGNVSGDWSIIAPAPGVKQYAFKGKPLFSAPPSWSNEDIIATGDWEYVVIRKAPPVPVAIGKKLTLTGDVYTNNKGMSLYTYNCNGGGGCDDPGDPAAFMVPLCGDSKECARRWKPYLAAPGAKPEGEFTIIDITYPMFIDPRGTLYPPDAPKVRAWAYRNKPLFTYYEDEKPGDMWGNNVGGIWGSSFTIVQVPGRSATQFEP